MKGFTQFIYILYTVAGHVHVKPRICSLFNGKGCSVELDAFTTLRNSHHSASFRTIMIVIVKSTER